MSDSKWEALRPAAATPRRVVRDIGQQTRTRTKGKTHRKPSTTKPRKRGALAELRQTLSAEQYAMLERAIKRKERGGDSVEPQRPQTPEGNQVPDDLEADQVPTDEDLPVGGTRTVVPDRWCERCKRARATLMCGVCAGTTVHLEP